MQLPLKKNRYHVYNKSKTESKIALFLVDFTPSKREERGFGSGFRDGVCSSTLAQQAALVAKVGGDAFDLVWIAHADVLFHTLRGIIVSAAAEVREKENDEP